MSSITCEQVIREHLQSFGRRFSCYEEGGRLWIVSPYAFLDGDLLEITVIESPSGELRVTDLGETLRHLSDHGFDPRSTPKGEYLLAEILKQHDVDLDRGMIVKRVPLIEVGTAIQEVLTASLAVAHLLYLSRSYRPATFTEEVTHFLIEQKVKFESRYEEIGRTGRKYTIDFLIHGKQREVLLQTLSPTAPRGATPMVNAAFRLWSDVVNGRWRGTLLDDRFIQWRREDVLLLEGVSEVYRWTQREEAFHKVLMEV
ncbi:MAG: DUF1828 domain-containing protein [Chloroflexi bacterium]|nr:DUF1828 domain-containing protein [Chloroflexota bacterium]